MSNHDKNKNILTNWQLIGNGCYGGSNSYHIDGSSVDGSSDVISRSQLTFISVHSSAVTTPLCTGCFGIWTFCGSDSDGALW